MTNRFLISVATAALIAGTGLANAQAPGRDAGSPGSAAQQSAPPSGGASSGGAMQRDTGGTSGMKGAESGMKGESGIKGSEPGMKASDEKAQPSSKSAQDGNRMQGEKSKSMHSETDSPKGGKDMKAEGRDSKSGDMNNAQTKGATDTKSGTAASETKSQTTGNAATSATAAPPPEKRTQINTAIRSEKIQETTNVNFNISVGAAVPASVHFHPLPPRIVEIYPEWRGYEVILVHGRYVIVRPQTREIVYIIEG
jgi:Protein of unknown function (DUF1236)